jgi:hypothetical protein
MKPVSGAVLRSSGVTSSKFPKMYFWVEKKNTNAIIMATLIGIVPIRR